MSKEDLQLAAIGGLLIGLASSLHYIVKGRITGFSGIFYSLISFDTNSFFWKLCLMSSVVLASTLMFIKYGHTPIISGAQPAFDLKNQITSITYVGAAIAGFLVGFGTKLGNGCTSGHGVCGLPRLSKRSFVAVTCFMAMGMLTATCKDRFYQESLFTSTPFQDSNIPNIVAVISTCCIIFGMIGQVYMNKYSVNEAIIASLVGFIFGLGLVVSGMVKRSKILHFLTLNENWDPSLLIVMLVAVGFNLIAFRIKSTPLLADMFETPKLTTIDSKLVVGASVFGIGWGWGGLCPGPAFALYPEFTLEIGVMFMCFMALGQLIAQQVSMRM